MTKGRTPPELPTFTFPTSGFTIKIRRLSPFAVNDLQAAIQKEYPRPEPPVNLVDYGDGKQVAEPNTADPHYSERLQAHETFITQEIATRFTKVLTSRAIECEVDADEVAEIRRDMAAVGVTFDGDSDKEIYVRYVLIQSEQDMDLLRDTVLSRSQPTEAAIADNVTAFRGDVSGS